MYTAFVENLKREEKTAKDGKKFVKRKPPEHNFVNWDKQTFQRLIAAPPCPGWPARCRAR